MVWSFSILQLHSVAGSLLSKIIHVFIDPDDITSLSMFIMYKYIKHLANCLILYFFKTCTLEISETIFPLTSSLHTLSFPVRFLLYTGNCYL
jgi:hypothetical protein